MTSKKTATSNQRIGEIKRDTLETIIEAKLILDSGQSSEIKTNAAFFDHMIAQLAKHSRSYLFLKASGDIEIDYHHLLEDVGLVLGEAWKKAIGDKAGILRYGECLLPMDEACSSASIDICNRSYAYINLKTSSEYIGNIEAEAFPEFFKAFAASARISLHLETIRGENNHHIIESSFKALAVALYRATRIDPLNSDIPSTKGKL